jgi:hypothetical protein
MLMRAKEKQDDFNAKLMKILDIIENKMDKEIVSSRSRICRSHDEKRGEERSVDRRQPHSQNHCFQKV